MTDHDHSNLTRTLQEFGATRWSYIWQCNGQLTYDESGSRLDVYLYFVGRPTLRVHSFLLNITYTNLVLILDIDVVRVLQMLICRQGSPRIKEVSEHYCFP